MGAELKRGKKEKPKRSFGDRMILVLSCFAAGTGLLVLLLGLGQVRQIHAEQDTLQAQIKQLESELSEAKAYEADPEVIEVELQNASLAGNAVAEQQNRYFYMGEIRTGDDELYEQYQAAVDAGRPYFADSSDAGQWFFAGTEYAIDLYWKFETPFDFAGNTVSVLWSLRQKEDPHLAGYATAVYDSETDTFSDVSVFMTTYGATLSGYADPSMDGEVWSEDSVSGNSVSGNTLDPYDFIEDTLQEREEHLGEPVPELLQQMEEEGLLDD